MRRTVAANGACVARKQCIPVYMRTTPGLQRARVALHADKLASLAQPRKHYIPV